MADKSELLSNITNPNLIVSIDQRRSGKTELTRKQIAASQGPDVILVTHDRSLFDLPEWQRLPYQNRPRQFQDANEVWIGGRFLGVLWNHSHCRGWQFYVGRQRGGYRPEANAGEESVHWRIDRALSWMDVEVIRYEEKVSTNPGYIRSDVPPPNVP